MKPAETLRALLILGMFFSVLSCGGDEFNNGENYGDILSTADGLTLTQEEHEIGWGHSDCTTCHNLENIHLVDRSSLGIDIEQIHDQVLEEGVSICQDCHGSNGL